MRMVCVSEYDRHEANCTIFRSDYGHCLLVVVVVVFLAVAAVDAHWLRWIVIMKFIRAIVGPVIISFV